MIVFIAGMPRSGSTFSFNIAREILCRRGSVYQEATTSVVAAMEHAGDARHILLKAHSADSETTRLVRSESIKAICTIRRPEDAVASWMEAFNPNLKESLAIFETWFAMYESIRSMALTVSYDEIDTNPLHAARAIARFVDPQATEAEIAEYAARHSKSAVLKETASLVPNAPEIQDIGFSYYDTRTFYHRRHVSSLRTRSAVDRIGADAVRAIREVLGPHISGDDPLDSGRRPEPSK